MTDSRSFTGSDYADLVRELHQAAEEHDRGHGPLHASAANAIDHLMTLIKLMQPGSAAQRPIDCGLSDLIAAKMREPAFAAWKAEYNEVGLLPIIKVCPTAVSDWRVVLMSGREMLLSDGEWKSAALAAPQPVDPAYTSRDAVVIEKCAKIAEGAARQREWPQLPEAQFRAPTASMQMAIAAAIRALAIPSTDREAGK